MTGISSYSDSKLHVLILSMAVARKWSEVYSKAVNPGWVPTKMGGPNAPDNLQEGAETQVRPAISNDSEAKVSGRYFYHKKEKHYLPVASECQSAGEIFLTYVNRSAVSIFQTKHRLKTKSHVKNTFLCQMR